MCLFCMFAALSRVSADILTFQEVENKEVLQRFVNVHLKELGYSSVILEEGLDQRGIDVALVTRLPVLSHKIHEPSDETWHKPSRPVLEVALATARATFIPCRFQVKLSIGSSQELIVFVNHWPSKRGGKDAERERGQVASSLIL